MSIYGENIINLPGVDASNAVTKHMANAGNSIQERLNALVEETASYDLDDDTARQITLYQSRLLLNDMFLKVHLAMANITKEKIDACDAIDTSRLVVGLTGRIETIANLIERLQEKSGSDTDRFMAQLRSMTRDQAFEYLRDSFAQLFGNLFTDAERERLFNHLEEDAADESNDNVRSPEDGTVVGSTRWAPKSGPTTLLPPARRSS